MSFVGIALATSIASWLGVALLAATLARRGHFVADPRLKSRLLRILLASAAMGAALWLAAGYLAPALDGKLHVKTAALAALVLGGLAVYGGLALATGVVRPGELRDRLRRRGAGPAGGGPA
jgi:putative peptidoglycan lipid II flippase